VHTLHLTLWPDFSALASDVSESEPVYDQIMELLN